MIQRTTANDPNDPKNQMIQKSKKSKQNSEQFIDILCGRTKYYYRSGCCE